MLTKVHACTSRGTQHRAISITTGEFAFLRACDTAELAKARSLGSTSSADSDGEEVGAVIAQQHKVIRSLYSLGDNTTEVV